MAKRLTMKRFKKALKNSGACKESLRWLSKQKRGPKEAILVCENPLWMDWLYIELSSQLHSWPRGNKAVGVWNSVFYTDEYLSIDIRGLAARAMEAEYTKGLLLDRWPEVEAWFLRESEK